MTSQQVSPFSTYHAFDLITGLTTEESDRSSLDSLVAYKVIL